MRRGISLVEILVVLVVLVGLAAFLLPKYLSGASTAAGLKGDKSPITYARDTVCQANLRSVRQVIEAARATAGDEPLPATLEGFRELTPDLRKCPVGGEAYRYGNGQVTCPHPGHEGY